MEDWANYFKLGVPSTCILCAEYWAWNILGIMSANFGVEQQAAMMITIEVANFINTVSIGIQEATCVLVGI